MVMVSSYFAQVGIDINKRDLRTAQAYFKSVERIIKNFQRRVSNQQAVNLRFKIDRTTINKQLQTTMNRLSKNVVVPITRFDIKRDALTRAINRAIPSNPAQAGSVRIGLRISNSSLTHMRDQIRSAIEGTVIRPRISPIVQGGRGRLPTTGTGYGGYGGRGEGNKFLDPRNNRRMSPWHNPMMIGGGLGAFMRYGFYSLPFVGGVIGLNAANNFASMITAQRTSMDMVSDMSTLGVSGEDNRAYLKGLSESIGKKQSSITPIYTQMLAASQGTSLEPKMQDMFSGILQYASVMGLGEESIKRAMTGFQQMIG